MNIIISVAIVILVSYLLTLLAKKINIPKVVALIVGGILLGIPLIKNIFIEPNTQIIFGFGDIALVCLMFLAGLESSWREMYHEKKDAILIAIFAALTPFLLGFIIFQFLGFPLIVSLITGICMSITAEATKARVLLGLHKIKTKIGSVMMGAGIIDEILGLFLFILVTILLKKFHVMEEMLIGMVILAFFAGILVQKKMGRDTPLILHLENGLLYLVVPFFFISMGLHFNLNSLIINPILLLAIILIATVGKLGGTLLVKPFTKLKLKQLYLIGWGMNSRGAIEMALALIAFRSNLIPVEIYSGLVIMALVTTLAFPFILTKIIKKNPKIMNA